MKKHEQDVINAALAYVDARDRQDEAIRAEDKGGGDSLLHANRLEANAAVYRRAREIQLAVHTYKQHRGRLRVNVVVKLKKVPRAKRS